MLTRRMAAPLIWGAARKARALHEHRQELARLRAKCNRLGVEVLNLHGQLEAELGREVDLEYVTLADCVTEHPEPEADDRRKTGLP